MHMTGLPQIAEQWSRFGGVKQQQPAKIEIWMYSRLFGVILLGVIPGCNRNVLDVVSF